MKRFRQAAVSYARKRARTFATAVGKRVVRSVKKRVSRRMSKMQSKSITAFRKLGGNLKLGNSIRSTDSATGGTSNFLYFHQITDIAQGNTNTTRESNNILLKGFAYNFLFRNQVKEKVYLNFACITPKAYQGNIDGGKFYRDNNIENNINFDDASLNALSKYDRPINQDQFIIHFRKKFILGGASFFQPDVQENFDQNSNNCKHIKGYKSIKSRVSYSVQDAVDVADYKIFLVWWFTQVDQIPPLGQVTGVMAWDKDIQVLFNGE